MLSTCCLNNIKRWLNTPQTPLRESSSNKFTAAVILLLRSSGLVASGGTRTTALRKPLKKRSQGVKSRDLGSYKCSDKSWGPVRPIQRRGRVVFTKLQTFRCQCCGAPSWLKDEIFKIFIGLGKKLLPWHFKRSLS